MPWPSAPLPTPFCPGYRDRNELGDWGRRRAEGQELSGITQTDTWNIIPNILVIVEQEAAKNVDS